MASLISIHLSTVMGPVCASKGQKRHRWAKIKTRAKGAWAVGRGWSPTVHPLVDLGWTQWPTSGWAGFLTHQGVAFFPLQTVQDCWDWQQGGESEAVLLQHARSGGDRKVLGCCVVRPSLLPRFWFPVE